MQKKLKENIRYYIILIFLNTSFGFLTVNLYAGQGEFSSSGVKAFPQVEGYGSNAIGGRGGRVIKITNLNSGGPGSLANACAQSGSRIVVFEVSGVIHGDIVIEHPYITIAGQTAPGAGITIDGLLRTGYSGNRLHDIIIRFLRIRPTNATGESGDALQLPNCDNIILDHLSLSWACDEVVDLCGTTNATIQWCTVEESSLTGHPKGEHNLGMITGYYAHSISIHHNLFTHHRQRNPFGFCTPLDLRNNVIYNHQDGSTLGIRSIDYNAEQRETITNYGFINVIGNYYKSGPNSKPRTGFPYALSFQDNKYIECKYYFANNCVNDPDCGIQVFDNPIQAAKSGIPHIGYRMEYKDENMLLSSPVDTPPVITHSVLDAYELVLEKAGCHPRDVVTKRNVTEVRQTTGSWGKKIPADLMEGLKPNAPLTDSDNDGIPDSWEQENGLNFNDPYDYNHIMPSGYTAIEEYINELAIQLSGKVMDTVAPLPPTGVNVSGEN